MLGHGSPGLSHSSSVASLACERGVISTLTPYRAQASTQSYQSGYLPHCTGTWATSIYHWHQSLCAHRCLGVLRGRGSPASGLPLRRHARYHNQNESCFAEFEAVWCFLYSGRTRWPADRESNSPTLLKDAMESSSMLANEVEYMQRCINLRQRIAQPYSERMRAQPLTPPCSKRQIVQRRVRGRPLMSPNMINITETCVDAYMWCEAARCSEERAGHEPHQTNSPPLASVGASPGCALHAPKRCGTCFEGNSSSKRDSNTSVRPASGNMQAIAGMGARCTSRTAACTYVCNVP